MDLSNITVTISPSNADQNTYSWSVAEDEGALESSKYTFDATNKTLTAEVDGYVKLQCTAGSQSTYLIVNITAGASASFLESEIEGIANVTSAKEMTVSVYNYTSITSYDWSVETIDPETGKTVFMYENYGIEELIGPSEKYDMIYLKSDGIYGYNYKNRGV